MLELSKWDLDVETNDGEEYTSLVRAVRRTHQRFKLLFISCSPSQGEKIRCDLMSDIPAKKYELLDIKESINNLYEAINNTPNLSELDVLFIRGLEYSIFEYEDREFGDISKRSQSQVYGGSWAGVPPVLARLNMQRELFRDRFPHICFVFLLPHFAIDYFIRRAPDFYDWKSGIYRFETDLEDLQIQVSKILYSESYDNKYDKLVNKEKLVKIREIRACLDEVDSLELRWQLLSQLGLLYSACNQYSSALDAFDAILKIKPDNYEAWFQRSVVLNNLDRNEESIDSYNHTIQFRPNDDKAWYNRGIVLDKIGRYEEAIDSYDHALQIKPKKEEAWCNRGITLDALGRYEEAINSYDRALQIKQNDYVSWHNRGYALDNSGKHKEAIDSYNRALQIKPDLYQSWYNNGISLYDLGRYEESLCSYKRALEIEPKLHQAWQNCGIVFAELGKHVEAIDSYNRALKINSNQDEALYNLGISLGYLGRYEEAIDSYDRTIQIKPNLYQAWHNKGIALYKLGKYKESLNAYKQTITIKPDKYESWYDIGLIMFCISNHDETLAAWKEAFNIISKLKPRDTSDLIQEFFDEQLLPKFQQPAVRDILPQILTIYTTAQVLPELGVALTRNLKAIQSATISDYTATEWLKMWQELGKPHPELALALRMLEAGIKYKQNPTDDRVFLSLPQEMRPLLREALGLE
jgi:tetratricopeptide (TPR) repeat protein